MLAFPKQVPVRLKGNAMRKLRMDRFLLDCGRCVDCGVLVSFNGNNPKIPPMHLAHVRNKRMFGDTLENTRTKCSFCHLVKEHNGGKVVPAK
jgi:hypothetical protein